PDRRPVGYDHRVADLAAQLAQPGDEERPAGVGVHPGRRAVGRDDHPGLHSARSHSPVLPPSLRRTRTRVSDAAGSTALTMSISASPAAATAVSASISTPVRSAVLTATSMSTVA